MHDDVITRVVVIIIIIIIIIKGMFNGGPRGPAVKSAHLTAVTGVSGGFSQGFPVFVPPTDWPISYI